MQQGGLTVAAVLSEDRLTRRTNPGTGRKENIMTPAITDQGTMANGGQAVSLIDMANRQTALESNMAAVLAAVQAIAGGMPTAPAPSQSPVFRTDKQVAAATRAAGPINIATLRAQVLAKPVATKIESDAKQGVEAIIGGRKMVLSVFETVDKVTKVPTGRKMVSINGREACTLETLLLRTSPDFIALVDLFVETYGSQLT